MATAGMPQPCRPGLGTWPDISCDEPKIPVFRQKLIWEPHKGPPNTRVQTKVDLRTVWRTPKILLQMEIISREGKKTQGILNRQGNLTKNVSNTLAYRWFAAEELHVRGEVLTRLPQAQGEGDMGSFLRVGGPGPSCFRTAANNKAGERHLRVPTPNQN